MEFGCKEDAAHVADAAIAAALNTPGEQEEAKPVETFANNEVELLRQIPKARDPAISQKGYLEVPEGPSIIVDDKVTNTGG